MECVFGLVGDGFALVVADTSAVHSILVHKSNEDKIMVLDSHKLLGASGESGDRSVFLFPSRFRPMRSFIFIMIFLQSSVHRVHPEERGVVSLS